jgi:hypothetical protein
MSLIATEVPARAPEVWTTLAKTTDGTTNTALRVRYPDGDVIPVGVPGGMSAQTYAEILSGLEGYTILSAVKVGACGTRAFSSPA